MLWIVVALNVAFAFAASHFGMERKTVTAVVIASLATAFLCFGMDAVGEMLGLWTVTLNY